MKPSATLWCFGSMRFFLDRSADFRDWNYAQDIVWEKHNGTNALADRFRRVHELIIQFYPKGRPWADVYKQPQHTDDATARTLRRKQKPQHWSKIETSRYTTVDGGPRLLRSVLFCRSEHGHAIHETQKPAALLIPLIRYSCPEGGGSTRSFCRIRLNGYRRPGMQPAGNLHRNSQIGDRRCARAVGYGCAAPARG